MNVPDPRDHLTDGVTRGRLLMEAKRSVKPSGLFLAGVALSLLIVGVLVTNISEVLGRKTQQFRLEVDTAFGIFEGFDDVRFRGVAAGTITKVERDGAKVILVAELRKDAGTVYRDAKMQIRPVTPLNDVYLDIVDPGTEKAGIAKPDEPLPRAQTQTAVTVPDVLDVFEPDARLNTYRLLDQLGNGLEDGGIKLQRALVALDPFLEEVGDLSAEVAAREAITKRLVHNTALLTTELGRRDVQLRRLVETGAATVASLQDGRGDLDATLRELGPTFTELQASLAAVDGVVDDVDTGLSALYPVADRVPEGLAALRGLSDTLRPAAADLRGPVTRLGPLLTGLDGVNDRLEPIVATLRDEIPTVDRLSQRLIDCEDGIVGFFQWNASLGKFGDSEGPKPRGNLAIGAPAVGAPGEPLREPEIACAPGLPPRGVPTEEDKH